MAGETREAPRRRAGRLGWLRRLDDGIFAAEQAVVVTFLIAMTVMVFLDVVSRRLTAPDSKVGNLVAKIGGIDDPDTRAFIDQTLAPWVGAALGLLLLWFAFWTAERHQKKPLLPVRQGPLLLALATAAGFAGLAWLMLTVPSRYVYLLLYALSAGSYVVHQVRRRPEGWVRRAGVIVAVVTPIFLYFAFEWFPRGYTWSKEMSLMLLLWVGFLGASVCAHEGKHLRMEAFAKVLPDGAVRWVQVAGFVATAIFCGFLALLGYLYVFAPGTGAFHLGGTFEQTHMPDWIATIAVPFAFGLTMVRFLAAAISAATGGTYGQPAGEQTLREAELKKAQMLGAAVGEETAASRAADAEGGAK